MEVHSSHCFFSKSIAWSQKSLEGSLCRILSLKHPLSHLRDHVRFTLQSCWVRHINLEASFELLVRHSIFASRGNCPRKCVLNFTARQHILRVHVDYLRKLLKIKPVIECSLSIELVHSFTRWVEALLDDIDNCMCSFFSFNAQQKHVILLWLNWFRCLILFYVCWLRIQVFFKTIDQLEKRARGPVPIESYFFEDCLQLSYGQSVSNVVKDLEYLRAADYIPHRHRALARSYLVDNSWPKSINFIAEMHYLWRQQLWKFWNCWINPAWLSTWSHWLWMGNPRCSIGAIGPLSLQYSLTQRSSKIGYPVSSGCRFQSNSVRYSSFCVGCSVIIERIIHFILHGCLLCLISGTRLSIIKFNI